MNEKINDVIALQQQGKLEEARKLSGQLLQESPSDVKLIHLTGMLAAQMGDSGAAAELLANTVKIEPKNPIYHNHYANAIAAAGDTETACNHYFEALRLRPEYPEAHNNLANVYYRQGDLDKAEEHYQKALRILPKYGDAHFNLANIFIKQNRFSEAIDHYKEAVKLMPYHALAYYNLGQIQRLTSQFNDAIQSFWKFLECKPEDTHGLYYLALCYSEARKTEEAVEYYIKVLELKPDHPSAAHNLGSLYHKMGRIEEALELYQQAVDINPDNHIAKYMLAALQGDNQEFNTAPIDYVEFLFDQYAPSYEQHLCQHLKYNAPVLLHDALEDVKAINLDKKIRILDLGCGTGLCGKVFKEYAKELIGIDISTYMLMQAHGTDNYTDLMQAEIVRYLDTTAKSYDLLLAADVFIYIGDLKPSFVGSYRVLEPGGWLAFTLEQGETDSYALSDSGRFVHNEKYVKSLAKEIGFKVKKFISKSTRTQEEKPIDGWVVVLQKI